MRGSGREARQLMLVCRNNADMHHFACAYCCEPSIQHQGITNNMQMVFFELPLLYTSVS